MTQKAFIPGRCGCQYEQNVDGYHLALVMCPMHTAVPELLAACKAVEKAHIKRTATGDLPYCDLCGRIQPEGPADYDVRHEDECPMPQVQAAITKASPQARWGRGRKEVQP